MNERVAAWWQRNRADFERWREPRVRTLGQLPAALRATLPAALRATFALPRHLIALLEVLDGQAWRSTTHWWTVLPGADDMVAALASEVRGHDLPMIESGGAWLEIAAVGDRSRYFVSCDRAAPWFGKVIEGYDDHPWLEGGLLRRPGRSPVDVRDAVPLVQWLDGWPRRPDYLDD